MNIFKIALAVLLPFSLLAAENPENVPTTVHVSNDNNTLLDASFIEYSLSAKSGRIKYLSEANALVLYAHSSALKDFFNALIALGVLGAGGVLAIPPIFKCYSGETLFSEYRGTKIYGVPIDIDIILSIVSAGLCMFSASMWYNIIKNYRMRNGFVPYLTIDSKGLKKFDEYIVEWKNVEKVDLLEKRTVTQWRGETVDVILIASFVDKFGDILFKIDSKDPLLPTTYEQFYDLCITIAEYVANQKNYRH